MNRSVENNKESPEYKKYKNLNDINKDTNNYLDPVRMYDVKEKYNISPVLCNTGVYSLHKKKLFSQNKTETKLNNGKCVTNDSFKDKKLHIHDYNNNNNSNSPNQQNTINLEDQNYYFYQNNKKIIRKAKQDKPLDELVLNK